MSNRNEMSLIFSIVFPKRGFLKELNDGSHMFECSLLFLPFVIILYYAVILGKITNLIRGKETMIFNENL